MQRVSQKSTLGCLHWSQECNEAPIASHLISESWLRKIADSNNQVLTFRIAIEDVGKRPVRFISEPKGVGLATTFPGFCSRHDNELFKCLDSEEFLGSAPQVAALAYRSVCQEICYKHQFLKHEMQKALSPSSPAFYTQLAVREQNALLHLIKHQLRIAEMLRTGETHLESLTIEFKRLPSVLFGTTFSPFMTFTGRTLEKRSDFLTMAVLPKTRGGVAVFIWDRAHSKNPSLLIKSLKKIPREEISSRILSMAFEVTENFTISPDWWNSHNPRQQQNMLDRFARSVIENAPPTQDIFADRLTVDWPPMEERAAGH